MEETPEFSFSVSSEDIVKGGSLRGGFPPGTKPAGTLILELPSPESQKNRFLLFKPLGLLWFVTAAQAD